MFDAQSLSFTFANQRALENLGYTMDELKWLTPADIQAHVFNQEMDNHISYLLNHKQSVRKVQCSTPAQGLQHVSGRNLFAAL